MSEHISPKDRLTQHEQHCRTVFSRLKEQDRRHVAGLLALLAGHGGVTWVANAVGLERDCVSRGKAEVENGLAGRPADRQRLPGGGRKPLEKKSPEVVQRFEKAIGNHVGGTPTGTRQFVRMSLRWIAQTVNVSHSTVHKWLRQRKYSLRSNVKRLSGPPHPDRNRQFKLIRRAITRFKNLGFPVISVDAKNKELIGNFANAGKKWEAEGTREEVYAHDFPDATTLKATPYGIYDVTRNEGHVDVGTSFNTARFAVDAIRYWWLTIGIFLYPNATRLLILADSGGSNGCRIWLWKKLLCELATELGLTITVRHYPRGASKWNPIEHRLFGPITKNWLGHPLRSIGTMLGFIRGTTTQTGLKVSARWNRKRYRPKEKVTKEEKNALKVKKHNVSPLWNYSIYPEIK
jgi:hypothetical protein